MASVGFRATSLNGLKGQFFAKDEILDRLNKGRKKALKKMGAYVRRSARSSLRRRKKASTPGKPPSVHSQSDIATLKAIFFTYDARTDSVVIGPLRLNTVDVIGANRTSFLRGSAPSLHEFGGTRRVAEELIKPRGQVPYWRRIDARFKGNKATIVAAHEAEIGAELNRFSKRLGRVRKVRVRIAKYPPRPFMKPALTVNIGKFPELFRNIFSRQAA